jgi:hypothetical protein
MTEYNQIQLDRDWMRSRYPHISMKALPDKDIILIYLDEELFGSLPMRFEGAAEVFVNWHEWRWNIFENYRPSGRVYGFNPDRHVQIP